MKRNCFFSFIRGQIYDSDALALNIPFVLKNTISIVFYGALRGCNGSKNSFHDTLEKKLISPASFVVLTKGFNTSFMTQIGALLQLVCVYDRAGSERRIGTKQMRLWRPFYLATQLMLQQPQPGRESYYLLLQIATAKQYVQVKTSKGNFRNIHFARA